jgi:hypothetical protein
MTMRVCARTGREEISRRGGDEVRHLGFMSSIFNSYKGHFWYYEVVDIFTRVCMCLSRMCS